MKLRAILLLSGASLLLAVSIPSSLVLAADEKGKMQAAPQTEAMPGKVGAAEMKRGGEEGVTVPMAPAEEMRAEPMPEGMARPGMNVPCPHPYNQTLSATTAAYRDATDFSGMSYHWASGLGDPNANVVYGYTFKLNTSDRLCCEITKAALTLNLKCINDIPHNDTWSIVRNGHGVVGTGGNIGWPQGCNGQTKTVTWPVTPAILNNMNQDHRLSFLVQDDTTVVSASLTVTGCCVLKH